MSTDPKALEAEALKLPVQERAQLAERLMASLFETPEIDSAWGEEVEHRIREIEDGRSELRPLADVVAKARAALK